MKITSSAFENYGVIPTIYTCEGTGINPPLEISGIPDNAKSLVLIVDDPDAISGTFVHWLVWNIEPKIVSIPQGSIPAGSVSGKNSSGSTSYIPPCPPGDSGTHHYRFKLSALNKILSLSQGSTLDELISAMEDFVIARAELVGEFSKSAM